MKNYFPSKTLLVVAVALAAAGLENPTHAQPVPPPANASALPSGIQPGTPAAEVVKLAQAGVDAGVIQNYISNCPSAFNVGADQIIALTDAGVSTDMVNAMIAHDNKFSAASAQPAPAAPAPAGNVEPAAPSAVTQADFETTLAPYGQWVQVDGYGRCWRPTTVIYDSTWQPYCDRGRWVYTDCGWYWDSDYSWGVTFHYGRWFFTANQGWCWWPDTVWAPSWVTWRSSGDYCGWAPLPPFAVYQPGIGFTYRGANVSVGFDFGLSVGCFTFVSVGNFCQPHPRSYCVPRQQVTQIYNQTTIINNYGSYNRTIVNHGVPVTTIGAAAHHPIQPISAATLANSRNHVWSAGNSNWNQHPANPGSPASPATFGAGNNNNNVNNRVPTQHNDGGNNYNNYNSRQNNNGNTYNNANPGHRPPFSQPAQPANRATESAPPSHPQNHGTPPNQPNQQNQPNQHQPGWSGRNDYNPPVQNFMPHTASPAPVAASRFQPSDARQNYSQPAPRTVAPAMPATPAPAQNQPSSAGGRNPNWLTQNH